jgi:hypothetical protein
VADTLRGFHDINDIFAGQSYSSGQRVTAIEYLPAQAAQAAGKLYYAYGDSYIPSGDQLSYAWCELDFTEPCGPWALADMNVNCQADYLFEIPASWAARHTPGLRLATGRYRNGSWCGHGPAIFAFGPWGDGNPPAAGTRLQAVELLHYSSDSAVADFHLADKWTGGAWLEPGTRSAVVLCGRKGLGEQYYGIQCGTKGYQSSGGYAAAFLFFDPAELAAVAAGELDVWSPQPYAMMNVNDVLFNPNVDSCDMNMIDALCYDRENNIVYGLEGDGSRTSMHVWRVRADDAVAAPAAVGVRVPARVHTPVKVLTATHPLSLGIAVADPAKARTEFFDLRGRHLGTAVSRRLLPRGAHEAAPK